MYVCINKLLSGRINEYKRHASHATVPTRILFLYTYKSLINKRQKYIYIYLVAGHNYLLHKWEIYTYIYI